ncbi:ribonuclease HI family protein [Paraliobacillus sp. JSM ZJ581]|uniref:ribonuclease HI family protein n=1 Tax=Paraliobacillus sp. JSM ZJ581 TaxID=3342118 RepID=UPI0035A89BEE
MLEVYVDGASMGNPGPSGVGVLLKKKNVFIEKSYYVGTYTNHETELIAVMKGLKLCKDMYPDEIISIRSDSKLVVDMIEKAYTKNKMFYPLLDEILRLIPQFPYCFIKWIPDNQNNHADRLARIALRSNQ